MSDRKPHLILQTAILITATIGLVLAGYLLCWHLDAPKRAQSPTVKSVDSRDNEPSDGGCDITKTLSTNGHKLTSTDAGREPQVAIGKEAYQERKQVSLFTTAPRNGGKQRPSYLDTSAGVYRPGQPQVASIEEHQHAWPSETGAGDPQRTYQPPRDQARLPTPPPPNKRDDNGQRNTSRNAPNRSELPRSYGERTYSPSQWPSAFFEGVASHQAGGHFPYWVGGYPPSVYERWPDMYDPYFPPYYHQPSYPGYYNQLPNVPFPSGYPISRPAPGGNDATGTVSRSNSSGHTLIISGNSANITIIGSITPEPSSSSPTASTTKSGGRPVSSGATTTTTTTVTGKRVGASEVGCTVLSRRTVVMLCLGRTHGVGGRLWGLCIGVLVIGRHR